MTQTNPTILILGYGRHGKDTFAEMLAEATGLEFVSSSFAAAEEVLLPLFNGRDDLPSYDNVDACYADRSNHRAVWFDAISGYNTPDKSKLPAKVLEIGDMYVGMRCKHELQASLHLFDHVVWVDASERGLPPEDESSCTVAFAPHMFAVDNSGDLDHLKAEVKRFVRYTMS